MYKAPFYLFSIFLLAGMAFAPGISQAQSSLDSLLKPYLNRFNLPALSAAVVKNGEIIASSAVGTRRAGMNIPVTINDRFHIGSDTKAMTATLAAMMIEEGRLRWNSTMAEIFPELQEKMHPTLRTVTLEQLMSHTAGIAGDGEEVFRMYGEAMSQEGNLNEIRYSLLRQAVSRPLESLPGTQFTYSNLGYIIVGAAVERVAGKTWEEMITERIFLPLGMTTAGLGPQASIGKIDAPLGHAIIEGKTKVFLAGPNGDCPPVMGPAGIAHMSVLDFGQWAGWNVGEGKRGPALVKKETLKRLHSPVFTMPPKKDAPPGTPPGGKYAYGWGQLSVDWAPRPLLYHGGSNSMNLAHIWLDTDQDLAIVIMTNIGGTKAEEALLGLASELYRKFGGAPLKEAARP